MRIRSIKPEFWRSDDITALSREDRLLFIGLWSYVDDNGVGLDDERRIAADLFAFEDDQKATRDYVRDGLATLSRRPTTDNSDSLIVRYEVGGKRYFYVTGWSAHQRIDRPGKPRYPLPSNVVTSDNDPGGGPDGGQFATPSRDARETPATGTGEQGNRGTGEPSRGARPARRSKAATTSSPEPAMFDLPEVVDAEIVGEVEPAPDNAGTLIAEWIDHCAVRPPGRVIGHTGKVIREMLDEGIPYPAVRGGLAEWSRKGAHPSALASFVNQVANRGRHLAPVADRSANGGLGEGTAAERANAFLSLIGTRGPNGERLEGRGTG